MSERFRIYGFGFEYPKGCIISFGKESWRRTGYLMMDSAGRLRISVSWGELDSILPRFASSEVHAKYSVSRIAKASDVKDINLISTSSLDVNGHQATFTHFTISSALPILAKTRNRETRSLHVHCGESNRYFILTESSTAELSSNEAGSIFKKLKQTFICH
jgi:hypothetical protein